MNIDNSNISASPVHALSKQLKESFPVFRNAQPLSIGIDKQIIARLPEINRKVLRSALGMHTKSSYYLSQITKASTRFDLDGNAAEQLTESHRIYAATLLKERVRKDEERRLLQCELEHQRQRELAETEDSRKRAEKIG